LTPDRWQQISRIFKLALSLDGEAREAFVKGQCGVDDTLRAEVEKLIDSHQKASDEKFIDGVAAEANAVLLIDDEDFSDQPPRLNKGQQLGFYVILDAIGVGGMGEVYLAKDTRLDRTVALKVLSEDVATDDRRMKRFRKEAKMASSLNQPNILTIFEFGEIDGLSFLATEFIDGETLREHLRTRKLKIGEVIDITIQVLAALDAAHEAHIVHRDIKPENVMIRRRDGVVKVLDFGLAKVTGERKSSTSTVEQSELATEFKTAPHVLMGTINYMSPEQTQAHPVDERTDIWSTGAMIYEMVSGLMPFKGATVSHTIVQILEKDPVPLTQFTQRKVPEEMQRIVSKALAKSPDERYQTAKDMLIDLRSLKKRLDRDAEIERSSTSEIPRATVASVQVDRKPAQRRILAIALVGMAIATAAIFAFSMWRASRARTAPTVTTPPAASVPAEVSTLTYSITVQKYKDNRAYQDPFTLAGEINFEANYRIRLNVRSPQTGNLYVLNEGPVLESGVPDFVVLFPSPSSYDASAVLKGDQLVQIPEKTWLRFDAEQGVEKLWVIFATYQVPELERMRFYAGFKAAGHVYQDDDRKLIQKFLADHATAQPSVDKGDKETILKIPGKLLIHPIRLEHH
jgi:serine/threonine protein kinase